MPSLLLRTALLVIGPWLVASCSSPDPTSPSESLSAGGSGSAAQGGSTAAGGDPNLEDVVEKGLCSLNAMCPEDLVDEPKVLCQFEVRDSAGTLVYSAYAGMEIRGRSSQEFPKKNYGIELRTEDDVENPVSLLGLGKEADYVLDGAWADRSFVRNRLVFGLFRDIGAPRWAPQARYCELTLNGAPQGIYVLLEKIKRDDDRVDLPEDDGSGSTFLIKQDEAGELELAISSAWGGDTWQFVYPRDEDATATQRQAAQSFLDQLGTALTSDDPAGLARVLEPAAMVDWLLVEEFSRNIDGFNLSLFFGRANGAPAFAIPWDVDLSFGQPTLDGATNESPEGWIVNRTPLLRALSANQEIHGRLAPRWRELRNLHFSNQAINERLDGYAAILDAAALARNFALFPIEEVDFSTVYPPYTFYDVSSYGEEMAHVRTWIERRLAWLDANIDQYPTE